MVVRRCQVREYARTLRWRLESSNSIAEERIDRNPFRALGGVRSLDTILADRRLGANMPIALLVHVAHPRVTYTDRGKSTVLARSRDITQALEGVGKKWTQQMKAEERHSSARLYRQTVWSAPKRVPLKEIVYDNLPEGGAIPPRATWSASSPGREQLGPEASPDLVALGAVLLGFACLAALLARSRS